MTLRGTRECCELSGDGRMPYLANGPARVAYLTHSELQLSRCLGGAVGAIDGILLFPPAIRDEVDSERRLVRTILRLSTEEER